MTTLLLVMAVSIFTVFPASASESSPSQSAEIGDSWTSNGFNYSVVYEAPEDRTSTENTYKIAEDSEGIKFCYDEKQGGMNATQITPAQPGTFSPLKTCSGNGGVVRVDTLDQYPTHEFFWSVDPKLSMVSAFNGELEVETQGGEYVKTIKIWSLNPLGFEYSDTVRSGLPKGGRYNVTISGRSIASDGTVAFVVPNCTLSFTVY